MGQPDCGMHFLQYEQASHSAVNVPYAALAATGGSLMSAGWGSENRGERVMCCGRNGNTPSPSRTALRVSNQPSVGDRATRTIKWQLTPLDGSGSVTFDSEAELKAYIDEGNPGTKKVIAT